MSPDRISSSSHILVVEDEMMVGMLLEDMLSELGYACSLATSVEQATRRLEDGSIHGAIVDLNLNGEASFPVLDALIARNIPFIVSTGYGQRGIPERYGEPSLLPKPFGMDDLRRALSAINT